MIKKFNEKSSYGHPAGGNIQTSGIDSELPPVHLLLFTSKFFIDSYKQLYTWFCLSHKCDSSHKNHI